MNHYNATIEKYNKLGFDMTFWKTKTKEEIALYDISDDYLKHYINTYKPKSLKPVLDDEVLRKFNDKLKARIYIFEDVLSLRRSLKIQRIKNNIQ